MKTPVKVPNQIREAIAEVCEKVARKSREGRIVSIALAAVEPIERAQNGDVRSEVMVALAGDEKTLPAAIAHMAGQRKDFVTKVLDRLALHPGAMVKSLPFLLGFAGGVWFEIVANFIINRFMH